MMKKKRMIPYGRQFVPANGFAFLFVGEPQAWDEVKRRQAYGDANVLCLPDMADGKNYQYPVVDIAVIVIIYEHQSYTPEYAEALVEELAAAGAVDVVLRFMSAPLLESGAGAVSEITVSEKENNND